MMPDRQAVFGSSGDFSGARWRATIDGETAMKVLASVKKICRNCKIIRRNGVVRVICTEPRHKQRQG